MSSLLVFGATGLIGTYIINELAKALNANTFDRVAIFTSQTTYDNKPNVISSLQERGVDIYTGDVADTRYVRAVIDGSLPPRTNPHLQQSSAKPFDTVISAVGRNAILSQIPVFEIAEDVPTVKRIFPSEYGTDIEYDTKTSPSEPPHQLKLKVRAYIREHLKRLEYTYLVTGPYSELWLGKASNPRIGSFDVQAKKATVLYDGEGKVSFTTMEE